MRSRGFADLLRALRRQASCGALFLRRSGCGRFTACWRALEVDSQKGRRTISNKMTGAARTVSGPYPDMSTTPNQVPMP